MLRSREVPGPGRSRSSRRATTIGYAFDREVRRPAVFGTLLDPLPAGRAGTVDARARFGSASASGALQSRSEADVLNGANVAALRFGSAGTGRSSSSGRRNWSRRGSIGWAGCLRGQAGTDGVMPDVWPAGTRLRAARRRGGAGAGCRRRRGGWSGTSGSGRRSAPTTIRATCIGSRPSPASACGRIGRRISAPDGAATAAIELAWIAAHAGSTATAGLGTDVPLGEEQRGLSACGSSRAAAVVREIERRRASLSLHGGRSGGGRRRAGSSTFEVAQVSVRFGAGTFRKDRIRWLRQLSSTSRWSCRRRRRST